MYKRLVHNSQSPLRYLHNRYLAMYATIFFFGIDGAGVVSVASHGFQCSEKKSDIIQNSFEVCGVAVTGRKVPVEHLNERLRVFFGTRRKWS